MHQTVGQFTIVGQNQQAFGVRVEATDVEETLPGCGLLRNHIANARTAHVILHGGLHATRLIQDEVLVLFVDVDTHAIDANDIHVRVDAHALALDDFPVDFNAAGFNEYLCVATRCDARLSKDFLQAFALGIGIVCGR